MVPGALISVYKYIKLWIFNQPFELFEALLERCDPEFLFGQFFVQCLGRREGRLAISRFGPGAGNSGRGQQTIWGYGDLQASGLAG